MWNPFEQSTVAAVGQSEQGKDRAGKESGRADVSGWVGVMIHLSTVATGASEDWTNVHNKCGPVDVGGSCR
jgi:hypothetical protein